MFLCPECHTHYQNDPIVATYTLHPGDKLLAAHDTQRRFHAQMTVQKVLVDGAGAGGNVQHLRPGIYDLLKSAFL